MIAYYALSTFYVVTCLILLLVILLQQGKGDMAAAFGGGSSQSAFGARAGATVLSKATTISAILFMITSMTLSILATRGGSGTPDILRKSGGAPATGQPTAPVQGPAPGSTVPIQVQQGVDGGKPGAVQTIPVPVSPTPAPTPEKK